MESKLETMVITSIKVASDKFKDDSKVKAFEKSKADFAVLISKGLVRARGNHLLSLSDNISANKVSFNSK